MGIVFRQSLSNTVITYLGFGIGALNTLFLYTRFLTPEYYGLVGVILSTAAILMPLLAFGVPNTLIKYFSSFTDKESTNGFMWLMLILPLIMAIPLALLSYMANDAIGLFLAHKNAVVRDYVWHIFIIGLAMAYFEVFYAWSKVHLKTVFGNAMKEVFVRVGVTFLLAAVYLNWLSVAAFLNLLTGLYLLRTVIMMFYAFKLRTLDWNIQWPGNTRVIIYYSALIIFGASASVLLLEVDRFMINQFIAIENVAYYSVAVFIATVIAVPLRSMHLVTYPLTAEIMNRSDWTALKHLYQKSSLTLYSISGLIFILILLNLEDLYLLVPEAYRGGFLVVFLIGLTRVYEAFLGINSAILYNSEFYRQVLVMGFFLAILMVVFNLWLIPLLGIEGAALASLLALGIYNSLKLFYVWLKFRMVPFTLASLKITLLLLVLMAGSLVDINISPVWNIILRTIVIGGLYIGVIYKLRISEDIHQIISSILDRFRS